MEGAEALAVLLPHYMDIVKLSLYSLCFIHMCMVLNYAEKTILMANPSRC